MSKKYLDTKEGSLEQSVLGVWKEAALDEGKEEVDLDEAVEFDNADFMLGFLVPWAMNPTSEYETHLANYVKKLIPADNRQYAYQMIAQALVKLIQGGMAAVQNFARQNKGAYDKMDKNVKKHLMKGLKAEYTKEQAIRETNKNDKSDDGEGLDAVQPKAVKKKFKDRKDQDIDNDGDTDDSDKFLHKKRKAISKAMSKDEEVEESYEMGTDEYRKHTQEVTPGQDITDYQNFKVNSMKEALAKVWGLDEWVSEDGSRKRVSEGDKRRKENTIKNGKSLKEKGGKTATGEKKDEIDMNPEIGEKKER